MNDQNDLNEFKAKVLQYLSNHDQIMEMRLQLTRHRRNRDLQLTQVIQEMEKRDLSVLCAQNRTLRLRCGKIDIYKNKPGNVTLDDSENEDK